MPKIESGNQRIRGGAELSLFGRVDHFYYIKPRGVRFKSTTSGNYNFVWVQYWFLKCNSVHRGKVAVFASSQEKIAEGHVGEILLKQEMEEDCFWGSIHQTEYQDKPILSKGEAGRWTPGAGHGSMGHTNRTGQWVRKEKSHNLKRSWWISIQSSTQCETEADWELLKSTLVERTMVLYGKVSIPAVLSNK